MMLSAIWCLMQRNGILLGITMPTHGDAININMRHGEKVLCRKLTIFEIEKSFTDLVETTILQMMKEIKKP